MNMFTCIAIAVVFSSFLASIQCCLCKKPNVTEAYCKADFVAHVHFLEITSDLEDPFRPTECKVEFTKIYRKTVKFDNVKDTSSVYIPPPPACAIKVDMESKDSDEKNWIIFGTKSNGHLFINICWPNALWSKAYEDSIEDLAGFPCMINTHTMIGGKDVIAKNKEFSG